MEIDGSGHGSADFSFDTRLGITKSNFIQLFQYTPDHRVSYESDVVSFKG